MLTVCTKSHSAAVDTNYCCYFTNYCNNEEVIQDVQEWLYLQPKDFFLSGIRKLPDRWRKCFANQGDDAEK
jgi:hypothetical protein